MNISEVYVGVDVSAGSLDICIYPVKEFYKIENSESEIEKFVKTLKKYNISKIACEATGGYEKRLLNVVRQYDYELWIVDPRRIRGFIIASGCKTKTDKIDAQKIAEFASKNSSEYKKIYKTTVEEQVYALTNRKDDLTKMLAEEKTRLKHPSHALSTTSINKMIKILNAEIKKIEKQIKELIKSDKELSEKVEILESIPGIGTTTAAILVSHVPELGKLSNSQVSALTGLCPYDNESGKYKGKKYIRGGRAIPRKALYMCALTTIKYNLILKEFYDRLIEAKKPFKVTIVAVMHKLIILANSLLKRGQLCKV